MNICRTALVVFRIAPVMLVLVGCSSSPRFAERSEGSEHSGKTRPDESRQKPAGRVLLSLEGIVSYYGKDFQGKQTSSGEVFDLHALTAAHRTFPFGTKVRVTNLENSRTVVVRVNDRGPFVEGRMMDLSMGAAREIDLIGTGTARARLEVLEWGTGK